MTEHTETERDGTPSSESAKSESSPQTEGVPERLLKMKVTDLTVTEEGSRRRVGSSKKRWFSNG